MSPEKEELLFKQVGEIHNFLFGVEGQGGLAQRVVALENDMASTRSLIAKLTGAGIGFSTVIGTFGSKLWAAITGSGGH